MEDKQITTFIRLERSTIKAIDKAAKAADRSRAAQVRVMLKDWITESRKK